MILKDIAEKNWFRFSTIIIILINSILIGFNLTYDFIWIDIVQRVILYYFVLEFILRYLNSNNFKEFMKDNWNKFDLFLICIGFFPETGNFDPSMLLAFRTLRLFRVLRLLRLWYEVKITVIVFVKSLKYLLSTSFILMIFIYLYALVGVQLFQGETVYVTPDISPDPYGSVVESMYTLLRVMTGEDWTDIRYSLLTTSSYSVFVIDVYHISWIVLSSFMLLNLIIGGIVTNFQQVLNTEIEEKECNEIIIQDKNSINDFDTRLRKINKLLEDELISEKEFIDKRKEIIGDKW